MYKKILLITLLIVVIVVTCVFVCLQLNKENSRAKTDLIISYYNNPKIPEGFHTVDTETAKWTKMDDGVIRDWNKGLVIEDENGNQFVWIPVDKEDIFYDIEEIEEEFQYKPDALNMQNNDEKQILKYGGFYISRYEAGVPTELQDRLNEINSDSNDLRGVQVKRE